MDLNMGDIPPSPWWAKVGIAILGGCAKLACEKMSGKRVTFLHFFLRAIVSLFIGVICYHILPNNSEWGFAVTGLLSWMGADGITLLIEVVKNRKNDK